MMCFNVLSSALSAVITYHNTENRPKKGICVANHTAPTDVLVLMCDNTYLLVRFLRIVDSVSSQLKTVKNPNLNASFLKKREI